jgi:methyl-accepting chemotaxis protein
MSMGAMPSRAQSKLYAGLLPVERSVEALAAHAANLRYDHRQNPQPSLAERASRTIARFLIAFYIGIVATLAWQSYSEAARQFIASLSPRLGWLAPPTASSDAILDPVNEITRNVDRIVAASQEQMARSVDQLATGQEEITHTVDQLAASQDQIAREIIKLQAISQYGSTKSSDPSRPAHAVPRSAKAHRAAPG